MSGLTRVALALATTLACAGARGVAVETRYLANAGDDAADGRTPATAWRTLAKASAELPGGATLCLKSGDVFYGQLRPAAGLDARRPTVVTSWGEGPKPVISATKNLRSDPSAWEDLSHCFWRIDLSNPSNYDGLVSMDCNSGFLLVDGALKPWRRYCRADLVSPWDFCGTDGWLYVHADENPAKLAKDIRVALRVYCVQFGSFTVISNIAVRATGAHGMHAGWGHSVRDVRIADCDLENIGGSELPGYEKERGFRVRFGNGVELGGDAENVIIERCSFRGVYDVAFTMQGYPKKGWRNVLCRDCTMTDCSQAFEVWCRKAPKGVGFANCSFTGNRTLRVGGGWGETARPCRKAATPLLVYAMETDSVDIDVSGNVFEEAPHGLVYCNAHNGQGQSLPDGYRIHDNVCKKIGLGKEKTR